MAWTTPKTDWAPPDSVRDSDMNRIEGNILELSKSTAASMISLYVSPDGNDANDGASPWTAFKTFAKAVQSIPRNLNGQYCYLYVSEGTYTEDIVIRGGFNGIVKLRCSNSGGTITVPHLSISDGASVEVADAVLSLTRGVSVDNDSRFNASYLSTIRNTGYSNALSVKNNSVATIRNLNLGTTSIFGIDAGYNSRVHVDALSGTATGYAMSATDGSVISYGVNSATGIIFTSNGGRVNTGKQQ